MAGHLALNQAGTGSTPVPATMDAYLNNIKVQAIGPAEANQLLLRGDTTHVDQKLVNKYAYEMSSGLWRYPGGVLEVTSDGRLRDGHHRLLAVIQSGIPQLMIVVYNVPANPPKDIG